MTLGETLSETRFFTRESANISDSLKCVCTLQNDLEISTTDETIRATQTDEFESMIKNSELSHGMQELLGAYLALERYFLEESVNKAVGMDKLDQDQQTSSMVDDVFYIVKKCVRYTKK